MKKEKNNKKVIKKALNEAMLSSYEEMKSTPKRRVVRAWCVVLKDGSWQEQVTTEMSEALRNFYNNTKTHMAVPCTISYQVPSKPKKK